MRARAMILRSLLAIALMSPAVGGLSQEFNVMSLNIRYDEPRDSTDNWQHRRDDMLKTIQWYQPAFLGIQEGLAHQVKYMDNALQTYRFVGVGRDDGAEAGEFSAIFYDTTQFSCRWSRTFWLSETQDIPSTGWDAAYERICTYGLFLHRETNNMLLVFNTHFDHVGKVARLNSSQLILDKIRQLRREYPLPVILMGDFNVAPDEEPIQVITLELADALNASSGPLQGPIGTFNGFQVDTKPDRRIDYIFIEDLNVMHYLHLEDKTEDGRWISDHLPVLATISFK